MRRKAAMIMYMACLVCLERESLDLARTCIVSAFRLYNISSNGSGGSGGLVGASISIRKAILASAAYISKLSGRSEETVRFGQYISIIYTLTLAYLLTYLLIIYPPIAFLYECMPMQLYD